VPCPAAVRGGRLAVGDDPGGAVHTGPRNPTPRRAGTAGFSGTVSDRPKRGHPREIQGAVSRPPIPKRRGAPSGDESHLVPRQRVLRKSGSPPAHGSGMGKGGAGGNAAPSIPGATISRENGRTRFTPAWSKKKPGRINRTYHSTACTTWRDRSGNGPPIPRAHRKSSAAGCGTCTSISNTARLTKKRPFLPGNGSAFWDSDAYVIWNKQTIVSGARVRLLRGLCAGLVGLAGCGAGPSCRGFAHHFGLDDPSGQPHVRSPRLRHAGSIKTRDPLTLG